MDQKTSFSKKKGKQQKSKPVLQELGKQPAVAPQAVKAPAPARTKTRASLVERMRGAVSRVVAPQTHHVNETARVAAQYMRDPGAAAPAVGWSMTKHVMRATGYKRKFIASASIPAGSTHVLYANADHNLFGYTQVVGDLVADNFRDNAGVRYFNTTGSGPTAPVAGLYICKQGSHNYGTGTVTTSLPATLITPYPYVPAPLVSGDTDYQYTGGHLDFSVTVPYNGTAEVRIMAAENTPLIRSRRDLKRYRLNTAILYNSGVNQEPQNDFEFYGYDGTAFGEYTGASLADIIDSNVQVEVVPGNCTRHFHVPMPPIAQQWLTTSFIGNFGLDPWYDQLNVNTDPLTLPSVAVSGDRQLWSARQSGVAFWALLNSFIKIKALNAQVTVSMKLVWDYNVQVPPSHPAYYSMIDLQMMPPQESHHHAGIPGSGATHQEAKKDAVTKSMDHAESFGSKIIGGLKTTGKFIAGAIASAPEEAAGFVYNGYRFASSLISRIGANAAASALPAIEGALPLMITA